MVNLVKRLWQDEQGQDLAEYGIALAVIAAGVAGVVILVRDGVERLWSDAQVAVDAAANGGG
jgi:Flp pilus assembly pilin Flp